MNAIITTQAAAIQPAQPALSFIFDKFASTLDVQEITINSYKTALACFMEWAQMNCAGFPTDADLKAYKEFLAAPHSRRTAAGPGETIKFTPDTQNRYMRAVKRFFSWAVEMKLCQVNPAAHVKGAKVRRDNTKRNAFEKPEFLHLLDSIDRTTEKGKRDYAIILLTATAGLRCIELQRATIGNLEMLAGQHVLFVQGKGHTSADDYQKVVPAAYDAIMDYLATRKHTSKDDALFASVGNRSRERQMTEPALSACIKERIRAAGFDSHKYTLHSLRHSAVTFSLEAGATVQEAQALARHASPETTMIYSHNLKKQNTHTEQRIYDFLFDVKQDANAQAADLLRRMSADKQQQAIELLKALAG